MTTISKSFQTKKLLFLLLLLGSSYFSNAQTKGLIYEPATSETGKDVLDPNRDGYISTWATGFTSAVQGTPGNDVPEFENSSEWHNFPTIGSGEVLRDIRSGPDEGFTDFSITDDGTATYYRFDGTNMIFRFRLADYRPNAKGYTVLIDTDSQFGADDPEYSSENPGFELAIVLQNKQDVFIYDINTGTPDCTPTALYSHAGGTHHQKSISGIQDDGDLDFFYDFYVPIAEMGITSATTLRMAATTNTSNSYTFCGSLSDVGGVDDNTYAGCLECLFTDLIEGQVPTSPDKTTGFPAQRTDCPTILGSYGEGTISLSGISEPNAAITIYKDPDYSTIITTATADGNGDWTTGTFNSVSGEVYAAVGQVTGESVSRNNCTSVTIDAVTCVGTSPFGTIVPAASGKATIQVPLSGSFSFTNSQNATVVVYSNGVNITTATGTEAEKGMLGAPTNYTTYVEWVFDMVNGGEKIPCGTLSFTLLDNDNGLCESVSSTCNTTTGGCNTGLANIPIITTSTITTSTTSISGTSDALVEIALYVNGIGFASTTSDGAGSWTVNSLVLSGYSCQDITATANIPKGCTSAHSSPAITVTEVASAPTITDPGFCGSTNVIYGTSTNIGATIKLYINGSNSGETAIVNEYGKWAISGLSLAAGDYVEATATNSNTCLSESALSNQVSIGTIPANTGLGITTVDGTPGADVYESSTSISGTCDVSATTVNIYIDEVFIASATSVSSGTWILNPIPADELYEGGKIQVTQSTGGCESALSVDYKIVQCSSVPGQPTLSPYTQTCTDLTNTSVDFEISGVESGYIYTLVDNAGNNLGYSQYSAGTSNLTLSTIPLPTTPDPAIIKISAEKVNPGIDCSVMSTNSLSVDLNPHVTIAGSTSTPATCTASDGTITISGLGAATSYDLSYVRNGGTPITSTVTSEADGTYVITGLSNGDYTEIKVTTNSCTSPALTETLSGGGTTSTSFPVSANPVSVSNGGSSNILVGDGSNPTNASFNYYLYNRGTNALIAGPVAGNSGQLSISTGNLGATTTFYVYVDEGAACATLTTEPIVTVTANSAPVIAVPTTQSVCENGSLTLQSGDSNNPSIADADGNAQTVTITITNGTINLVDAGVITNDGTSTVTMTTQSLSDINTAFNGAVFSPSTDFSGTASIQIETNDGSGGTDTESFDITVNALPSVTLLSSDADNSFCAGSNITFTATSGFTNYNFRVNGTTTQNSGTNTYSTTTLTNGQSVDVIVTNANGCSNTSSGIVNSVTNNVTPSVSVLANPGNTVCSGTSVTYTATPINGGTPVYQWKVDGSNVGTNSDTDTYTPANGEVVTVEMTSDLTCVTSSTATSSDLTMTVNSNLTPSVTVAANPGNSVCSGTSVTYTATPINGGTPTYQWKVNGVNDGTGLNTFTYTPIDGDVVTVEMTSDLTCVTSSTATSSDLTMTVNSNLTPSVTVAANPGNNVCSGTSVTYTATPINGGTPTYQWKVDGSDVGSNSDTYTYTPSNGEVVTVEMTSDLTCVTSSTATSSDLTMTVNSNLTPSVTVAANPGNNVCLETSVTYTATPINGGTPTYQWKVDGVDDGTGLNTFTYTPIDGDVVTVEMTSDLTCVTSSTATSSDLTMTVNSNLTPSVSVSANPGNNVCSGTSVTYTATPINGGTPTYQWKVDGSDVGSNSDTYTYTPANGEVVTVEMTSDLTCVTSSTATSSDLTMTVNNCNSSPVTQDDNILINEESGSNDIYVLANNGNGTDDFGTDGAGTGTITLVSQPTNGSAVVNNNGTPNDPTDDYIEYIPNDDYNGNDSFTYEICDANGDCSTGTVYITVVSVNDIPLAVNDNETVNEDATLNSSVSTNDIGLGDGPVTFSLTTDVSNGSLTFNPDGTYTYTPNPDFYGTDSFTYTVCDADNECSTATVNITINSVDDIPLAVDDNESINENGTLNSAVGGNDTGLGDGPVTFSLTTDVSNGTLTFNNGGTYTYTPNVDFSGTEIFTYTVCDADGDCSTATVTIIVTEPDNMPVAVDDEEVVNEDNTLFSNVYDNDTNLDDTPVVFAVITNVVNGSLTFNSDGTYAYTPDENFNGLDSLTYTVCDGNGDCSSAKVIITINPVNDPPVANPDYETIEMNSFQITINVAGNDTDIDDNLDKKTVTLIGSSINGGSISVDGLGGINYTPAEGFYGIDTIPYQIFDTDGLSDIDTLFVTVNAAITVPNTFTPNGDGINDVLVIPGIEDYDNEIFIYNRWGNEVYHVVNYNNDINAWDGRAQNKVKFGGNQILPVGTYFYILKFKGEGKPIKGYVYLQY